MEIPFTVILSVIVSLQNFANATTPQLLCHVQNFEMTKLLSSEYKQNENSTEFKSW